MRCAAGLHGTGTFAPVRIAPFHPAAGSARWWWVGGRLFRYARVLADFSGGRCVTNPSLNPIPQQTCRILSCRSFALAGPEAGRRPRPRRVLSPAPAGTRRERRRPGCPSPSPRKGKIPAENPCGRTGTALAPPPKRGSASLWVGVGPPNPRVVAPPKYARRVRWGRLAISRHARTVLSAAFPRSVSRRGQPTR